MDEIDTFTSEIHDYVTSSCGNTISQKLGKIYTAAFKKFLDKIPLSYPHKAQITDQVIFIKGKLVYTPPEAIVLVYCELIMEITYSLPTPDHDGHEWGADAWNILIEATHTMQNTYKKHYVQ
jgi:hypothetical protein